MSKHTSAAGRIARPQGTTMHYLGAIVVSALAFSFACSSGSADPNDPDDGNNNNGQSGSTGNNNNTSGSSSGGSSNGNGAGSSSGGASNGSGGVGDGGSQSNGGEASNAGASNGGSANSPSVCDGATDIRTTDNGYVDNLENPDTDADAFWDSYVDANGGMAENRAFVTDGALGTTHGIHYAGSTGTTPGMGYAGLTRSLGCTDVSVFDGLSFWAKGTAGLEIFLQVGTPETQKEGGDCLEMCYDHPEKSIILSAEWEQHVVTWDELAQQGFGNPAEFAGMTVLLNWRAQIGDFDFTIDEVTFFAGDAPTGPVFPAAGNPSTPDGG